MVPLSFTNIFRVSSVLETHTHPQQRYLESRPSVPRGRSLIHRPTPHYLSPPLPDGRKSSSRIVSDTKHAVHTRTGVSDDHTRVKTYREEGDIVTVPCPSGSPNSLWQAPGSTPHQRGTTRAGWLRGSLLFPNRVGPCLDENLSVRGIRSIDKMSSEDWTITYVLEFWTFVTSTVEGTRFMKSNGVVERVTYLILTRGWDVDGMDEKGRTC